MRFYEVNCGRPAGEYDAAAKRKGVEPDFSYSDKTVIPKVFLLATTKQDKSAVPADKPDKATEKPVSITKKEASTTPSTMGSSSANRVEKEKEH